MKNSTQLTFLVIALAGFAQTSCTELECGTGTVERDGVCEASMPIETPDCGPGTTWNPATSRCELNYCEPGDVMPNCGVCEGEFEIREGIKYCVGGGGDPCASGIPACEPPDSGRFQTCGKVFDIETSKTLLQQGIAVDDLEVAFYDALGFATAQTPEERPPPLLVTKLDACGNFQAVTRNSAGEITSSGIAGAPNFVAVALDDPEGSDDFVLTGVAMAAAANTTVEINAYATRRDTITKWNTSVQGDPGAPSGGFEATGVLVPIFLSVGAEPLDGYEFEGQEVGPVAGVSITESGNVVAARDWYFTDTDPALRTTLSDGQSTTGANGSGAYFGGNVAPYGGTGPVGCAWTPGNAGNVPGVVFVAERHSVQPGCPQ